MKTRISWLVVMIIVMTGFRLMPGRTIMGKVTAQDDRRALPGINVVLKGTSTGSVTDAQGNYVITVPDEGGVLIFSFIGMKTKEVKIKTANRIDITMENDVRQLSETAADGSTVERRNKKLAAATMPGGALQGKVAGVQLRGLTSVHAESMDIAYQPSAAQAYEAEQQFNTEEYEGITENIFHDAVHSPLSTFSIDVDAASYSNMRRFIQGGQRPPQDAVRIEEMVNYFHYDYPQPDKEDPFSINTEISSAPWNEKHKLVLIGLQGKQIPTDKLPPS
ncbi:MAG TPA: von Willebrand factor type A domain-containing protein, partial [Cyclobacteriaceae bacterium]|nr:von Willebrand factor type A domain-containing protein [Cyclobacteriaceae bacterium]